MSHRVYVGLGSNLNNPLQQIFSAFEALKKLADESMIKCSSIYQSKALTKIDDEIKQPDYMNAVAYFHCSSEPLELLNALQRIENKHGRVRNEKPWQSRTLDLDLLLYDNQIINEEKLVVPHSGLRERNFVIYPLNEISPELILPDGTTIDELTKTCSKLGIKKIESI